MRRLVMGVIVLLLFITPLSVWATTTNVVSANDINQDTLRETENGESETQDESILQSIKNLLKASPTYLSVFSTLAAVIFYFTRKKELPLFGKLVIPVSFFLILLLIRILMLFDNADFLVTVLLVIVYAVALVLYYKNNSMVGEPVDEDNTSSLKKATHINKSTKRLVNKAHSSVKGIQVFSVEESRDSFDQSTIYELNLLGGYAKPQTNINTLFSSHIVIPDSLSGKISVIKQIQLGESKEENKRATCAFAADAVKSIKTQLNEIEDVNSITIEDCYKARVMLMLLSYWALCDKPETPYVGIEEQSLELQNKEVETALFTYARSGVLGSLLIDDKPYVFTYRRNTYKKGRFYYTFSCGQSKRFVVFITLENKNREITINDNLRDSLFSIQNQLTSYLVKEKSI